VARQFSTGTKFGSEKGKVQNPARIPPQTPVCQNDYVGIFCLRHSTTMLEGEDRV